MAVYGKCNICCKSGNGCNVMMYVCMYDMMFVLIGLHDVLGTSGGKKRLQLTVKSSNISKVTIFLF